MAAEGLRAKPSLRGGKMEVEPLHLDPDATYLMMDFPAAENGRLPMSLDFEATMDDLTDWIGGALSSMFVSVAGRKVELVFSRANRGNVPAAGFVRGNRLCVIAQGRIAISVGIQDGEGEEAAMKRLLGGLADGIVDVNGHGLLMLDDPGWDLGEPAESY